VKDYVLDDDQWQVVLGGSLGDGALRRTGAHAAQFRVGHGEAQKDYVRWKREMLTPFAGPLRPTGNGFGFDTVAMPALADLHAEYGTEAGSRRVTQAVLDRFDARGLAVWYGDAGAFAGSHARWGKGTAVIYNTALDAESRVRVQRLFERLGLGRARDDGRGFWFTAEQTARLHRLIAPYLHPAVDHKLHPSLRGQFAWHASAEPGELAARQRLRAVPGAVVRRSLKPMTRSTHRFDLQVAGNHTYLVDGVVVHNSPETTPGGRALKFYASVRIDVRRIDTIKQGAEAVGVRTKAKVVKNKLAPPFREAEFDMIYGEGISKAGAILDAAVEQGIVEKSGTWYTLKNERIGQGRENAKRWLQENGAVLTDLEAKIREALGLRPPAPSK
jgi:recombination protein RecA